MMKKTLLLCFIHGFKGGDDTFGDFPPYLSQLVQNALPRVEVRAIVYPKFETRGDLAECVSRFRDWLLEKVIDLEVANCTPSPTVDPSVRTILVGHSMGGIVAADSLIAITSDIPIDSSTSSTESAINAFMFPYIQGVLAFDTPYFGISPGLVALGAEGHYKTATTAFTQLSGLRGMGWGGWAAAAAGAEKGDAKQAMKPVAALPAPPKKDELPAVPAWQRWGKIAMYAGAAGAVAAGGAAAYMNRDQITEGWAWVGSHLEFVGCLMKVEELKKRVARVLRLNEELRIGFANLYTRLGKGATNQDGSLVGGVVGNQRTFCRLPGTDAKKYFHEAVNDAATDETLAHMSMFYPKDNPGYFAMSEEARTFIVEWATNEWYESSTGYQFKIEDEI